MIKIEINRLNDVENFLIALVDNLAQVIKEEIAAEPDNAGFRTSDKDAQRRSLSVSARPHRHVPPVATGRSKRGQRNFHVPGLDSRKRGGA